MTVRLSISLLTLVLLAGCEPRVEMAPRRTASPPPPAGRPTTGMEAQSATLAQVERDLLRAVNSERSQEGLAPLEADPGLTRLAREYSRRMAREQFFSHTAPDGDTLADRVQEADIRYSMIGENLFKGVNVPTTRFTRMSVEGWMDSPGHRKNILRESFTETGVGVWKDGATIYATQLFSRPR